MAQQVTMQEICAMLDTILGWADPSFAWPPQALEHSHEDTEAAFELLQRARDAGQYTRET